MKKNIFFFLATFFWSSLAISQSKTTNDRGDVFYKVNLNSIKPGKVLEFKLYPRIVECRDPEIKKLFFLDNNQVKIYVWYKGCPNNQISEEELVYSYYIDDATNYKIDNEYLKSDSKVIVLENENAGYRNGYNHLEKRYIISNYYWYKEFNGFRIFEQLDPQIYPARNGIFTNSGSCTKVYTKLTKK